MEKEGKGGEGNRESMYLGDCARLEEGGLLRRDGAGAFLGLLGVGLGAAFGAGGGGGGVGLLRWALGHFF